MFPCSKENDTGYNQPGCNPPGQIPGGLYFFVRYAILISNERTEWCPQEKGDNTWITSRIIPVTRVREATRILIKRNRQREQNNRQARRLPRQKADGTSPEARMGIRQGIRYPGPADGPSPGRDSRIPGAARMAVTSRLHRIRNIRIREGQMGRTRARVNPGTRISPSLNTRGNIRTRTSIRISIRSSIRSLLGKRTAWQQPLL